MSKDTFIDAIAAKTGLSKKDVKLVVDVLPDIAADSLKTDGKAEIPGVVKLNVVDRAERTGRNPRTGETLTVAAKKVITAKVGKAFEDTATGRAA